MKKSMILDLVADGSCYFDKINMFDNKEYTSNNDTVYEMFDKFCEGMPEDKKRDIIWKFETAYGGVISTIIDEYFKEGFKLGLIIAAQNFLD